jgi:DNA polymerase I-like protein with 3'-5' exonuclease and polymerase domains
MKGNTMKELPKIVAIDLEAHLITDQNKTPKIVCMTIKEGSKPAQIYLNSQIPKVLIHYLKNNYLIVGHYIAFDFSCICAHHPLLERFIWKKYSNRLIDDTLYREKLIDIALGNYKINNYKKGYYTLDNLSFIHLNMNLDKESDTRLTYNTLDGVPVEKWPKRYVKYAEMDVEATIDLFYNQDKRYQKIFQEYIQDGVNQAAYYFATTIMQNVGLVTDEKEINKLEEKLLVKKETLKRLLLENNILRPTGSINTKRLKSLVSIDCKKRKVNIPKTNSSKTYPEGQIKTSKDILETCELPALKSLSAYNHVHHMLSTYITMLKRGINGNRIIVRYGLTDNGRTSTSDGNIQNQPTHGGIRECYIPDPGYWLVSCDYKAFELVTLSQVLLWEFGESSLADDINAGYDPHLMTVANMPNQPSYDILKALKDQGDSNTLEKRQLAKVCNFGFAGGMGYSAFVDYARNWGIQITVEESKKLKKDWLKAKKEMYKYFLMVRASLSIDINKTLFVKQYISNRIRGNCSYTQHCNTLFSGLAADATKKATFEVVKACRSLESPLYESKPLAFIHDELIIESPKNRAQIAAEELSKIMINTAKEYIPDVLVEADAVISDRWYKSPPQVFDNEGKLTVYKREENE